MFGEISAWFYKAPGGINPDKRAPGFKNVILKPHFVKGLDHFEAEFNGPYGKIKSSWERGGEKIIYNVTIPPNSRATLYLEGDFSVREGNPLSVTSSGSEGSLFNGNIITLGAGSYVFLI
jgi:alpha-L-rhamnosidase